MRQTFVESILAVLPRLRRYAAAITGSSRAGDRYVELCLETLIQEPQRITSWRDPSTQLFKLLHEVIDACGLETEPHLGRESDLDLRQSLFRLDHADCRLLLLTLVEGFSLDQAARMLTLSLTEARGRLAGACAALHDLCVARILVIEDKKSLADDLADLINQSGHTLVGVAKDIQTAALLTQRRHPDVVVADFRHGVGGINAVRTICESENMPVVFLGDRPATLRRHESAPVFVVDDFRDVRVIEDAINRALFSRVMDNRGWRPTTSA
jgi:DNA-directed RNA polymerase specialized sigma24 family protein